MLWSFFKKIFPKILVSRSPRSYRSNQHPKQQYKGGLTGSPAKSMEPPKSPGRYHGGGMHGGGSGSASSAQIFSPRNMSPNRSPLGSHLHSPLPSPSPAHMKSPLPSSVFYTSGGGNSQKSGMCSPMSPRSPSPRPPRTTRFASQPTHLTSSNLAVLANRRKTSLAVSRPRHVTINPTSNFLELPGRNYSKTRHLSAELQIWTRLRAERIDWWIGNNFINPSDSSKGI